MLEVDGNVGDDNFLAVTVDGKLVRDDTIDIPTVDALIRLGGRGATDGLLTGMVDHHLLCRV